LARRTASGYLTWSGEPPSHQPFSEEALTRSAAQIATLEKQLAEAKQQVQDIAVKAIEGASGARALSHINQIAMEQAKNRPQG
jgi:colicin import membrane protein